jgi:hypothetical protein
MARILKCDGLLPAKIDPDGQFIEVQPADVRQMKAYIDANRALTTPFDIVVEGKTAGLSQSQAQDKLHPWADAGATWWIEGLWEMPQEEVVARIKQGPPQLF